MSKEAKELAGITERARIARESMAAVDVYDLQIATLRRERDEARAAALEEAVNLAIGLDLLKYEIDAFRELRDRAP
ncbi:MAG: hypothetical protein ACK5X3_01220 [Pseudomonadota bacterium]